MDRLKWLIVQYNSQVTGVFRSHSAFRAHDNDECKLVSTSVALTDLSKTESHPNHIQISSMYVCLAIGATCRGCIG